nr:unnamed protein product [Callosobruchus chinensis]
MAMKQTNSRTRRSTFKYRRTLVSSALLTLQKRILCEKRKFSAEVYFTGVLEFLFGKVLPRDAIYMFV